MIRHLGVTDRAIQTADVGLHRNFGVSLFDKALEKNKTAREEAGFSEENGIKKLITRGKRCLECD
eukprot:snap_masked-scaffold_31-processed-gene-3.30-mRNA-1 protein AED:1.00 eAED:1.00 QI:0/-1/0/0/-1/1/1/0/64